MKKTRIIKINPIFIIIVVFVFLCIIFKMLYVSTGNIKVKGESLASFASARDTRKKTITAKRGTIYSNSGEVLAKDVNSYTVIAYLDPSRTKDSSHPYHVVDKEKTAEKLSPLINMKKSEILKLLNTKIKSCDDDGNCKKVSPYQVELGPGGRGITELVKGQIEDLELPGIDFISSTKRYYPNGDFLSYTLGYAKADENGEYSGEMGIEQYYDDELTGENGYLEYQADIQGYQITSTPSVEKKSISGNDVYLTIDDNVQMFTEQAMSIMESTSPDWATLVIVEAKTGAILGLASTPSFNNNKLNIKSYYDPFVAYEYEPGSTMKIFSFLAAMENGIYDGSKKYKSGRLKVDDAVIKDWNGWGWGNITYDQGFMASSNVAASKLGLKLGRAKLKDFYNELGFGKQTGISLPNEANGIVNFKYNTEIAAASYGQGITVNASQMIQALTLLANDGTMIKPYIVSKIVNSEDSSVILENKRTEVGKICSSKNVNKMIKLMRGVVDGSFYASTGTQYYLKKYDLVGKTGTAQIASKTGGYLSGDRNHIYSFAGLFPGNDPQYIIYTAASRMTDSSKMKKAVKSLVKDVGTYYNINTTKKKKKDTNVFVTESYINKTLKSVKNSLTNSNMKVIVIGSGDRIVNQYPSAGINLNIGNKIFLLTNSDSYSMPDIKGWSRSDVEVLARLLGVDVKFTGYGYVTKYNIKKGSKIDFSKTLEVTLKSKYK